MSLLMLKSYWKLLQFGRFIALSDFLGLYNAVRRCPVASPNQRPPVETICSAMDLATIWYWKPVLCLQRSAATACLLKSHGWPAEMIIGGRQMPLKAHAWVEVNGRVVNDKPYMREIYMVLDRC